MVLALEAGATDRAHTFIIMFNAVWILFDSVTQEHKHTHTHAHTHARAHTHTRTRTHTHTHNHTPTPCTHNPTW